MKINRDSPGHRDLDHDSAYRHLEAGALTVDFVEGAARTLRWAGTEVIRAIDWPVRDASWLTMPREITEESVANESHGFTVAFKGLIANGALAVRVNFEGSSAGVFTAAVEYEALREFASNRSGFTVLHPLKGVIGERLRISHSDGSFETTEFPQRISPSQVAFDIATLSYRVCGVEVSIQFGGEVFEMEDQRNWSDASFKTYCRPLAWPVPFCLRTGETIRQVLRLEFRDVAAKCTPTRIASDEAVVLRATEELVPAVSIALDASSIPKPEQRPFMQAVAPPILLLRLESRDCDALLIETSRICDPERTEIDLEIVIPEHETADEYLSLIAGRCRDHGLSPARVFAFPRPYLRSYQPKGPWPLGLTPRDASLAARRAFPHLPIGGGALTLFTELNRCRPDLAVCDYLSHGSSALVHAADDQSVNETLEGLSHVFSSGRALAGDKQYRPGLISIGMRSNPYGADVTPNPHRLRLPMARFDPRQTQSFAAAWAVGVMAATAGCQVDSLALGMPAGDLGLLGEDGSALTVHPLFHVVRALSSIAGRRCYEVRLPVETMIGFAGESERGVLLLLANMSQRRESVVLEHAAPIKLLDDTTVETARHDPDWTLRAGRISRAVIVAPFGIAFIDLPVPRT
jgi:hypothetical protein